MFSFSFSNLRFDLFSPALFGFQESGLGLSLFLDLSLVYKNQEWSEAGS